MPTMMQQLHQFERQLALSIGVAVCTASSVAADSFEAQFNSPVHYGLAVAGISLAAAIAAALLGLLIYCLVRNRQNEDRKLTTGQTNLEFGNGHGNNGQSTGPKKLLRTINEAAEGVPNTAANFGPMALPPPPPLPPGGDRNGKPARSASSAAEAASSGTSGSQHSDGRRTRGNGGGGNDAAKAHQYVNPGFDGRDGAVLYRHSSFLRPVSYASLGSDKSHGSSGPDHQHQQQGQQPVITHAGVRTSPASTLDPHYFLSHGAINLQQQQQQLRDPKRLSYAEQNPAQQQQQQQQLMKRMSYAEQRAQTSSNVELVSGQVFASSAVAASSGSASSLQRPAQSRFPSRQASAMPTQQEELESSRMSRPAPAPPQRIEGPSFPRPVTSDHHHHHHQKHDGDQPSAAADAQDERPVEPRRTLRRIELGGGREEDGRSVTSTVLKQEALQAFEFLDGYEDGN